jgi:putative component of membrane protein insertase Oxa1/YidC/SpoIIIJ protein YidD
VAWLRQPHHRAFGFSRMKSLALGAIRFYQRHLSPHKGFCCAYRQHTGAGSCSELGHRAIRRYGVFQGLSVLNRRLTLCGVAHRRFDPRVRPLAAQRGDCDVGGCDPGGCDLPGHLDCGDVKKGFSWVCDGASCCDGCDWPRRKQGKQEGHVYIPPKRRRRGT